MVVVRAVDVERTEVRNVEQHEVIVDKPAGTRLVAGYTFSSSSILRPGLVIM